MISQSAQKIIDTIITVLTPVIGEIYGLDIAWDIERGLFFSLYCRGYNPLNPVFEVVRIEFEGIPFLILAPPGQNLNLKEMAEVELTLSKLSHV